MGQIRAHGERNGNTGRDRDTERNAGDVEDLRGILK